MLLFHPIRAMSCDLLRVSQYFAIPPKLFKRNEAVVRLGRRKAGDGQQKGSVKIKN